MKSDAVFQEKYDDLKLQMAMHLLREKELEAAEEEIKALNAQPEYQPNPQEEQMMMKVIDRTLQRQRWKHALKTASRMIQKVSVFLVILLIGIGTTVITVEAIRVPFINWLISLQENSTTIHFSEEGDVTDITFGYLPEGYQASLVSTDSQATYYSIENEAGNIIFLMIHSIDAGINVNTENAEVSEFSLNGQKATSIIKESKNTLVWSVREYSYMLEGQLAIEELIRIAENMSG